MSDILRQLDELDGLDLVFGGNSPQANPRLQFVQQPRQQPAPRYRPGEEPTGRPAPVQAPAIAQPQAQPSQAEQQLEQLDGLDLLFGESGSNTVGSAPKMAQPPANPNTEPDAPTWIGRRIQDVRGKQDPRYKGIPNIASVLQKEGGHSLGGELFSWTVGASDDDMVKTYQAMLGPRFVGTEKDANGYPLIVYRGEDGSRQRAYVNNPGIDLQDAARTAYGALPFVATGLGVGAALKGAPVVGRMAGQALGQSATSVAQDATAVASGVSDLDVGRSAIKAGVAGAGGAAAELAGAGIDAIVRRFITEPRYFNAMTGQLTPAGQKAAQAAGVDPAEVTNELAQGFARAMAKTGDPDQALRSAASNAGGIRRSMGEMTGNREQLLREQQMRGGNYGQSAREQMERFDVLQTQDIRKQVSGARERWEAPTIPQQLAPGRQESFAGGMTKADTGGNIRANTTAAYDAAKEAEGAAWQAVPRIKATPDALPELDAAIAQSFASRGEIFVDDVVTPMAANMAKALDEFKAGGTPKKVAEILPTSPVGDVTTMRKRLLRMRSAAQTPEDKRAAGALYEAFIEWEVTAAEKAGNLQAAALARTARDATRQLHETFDGQPGTAGANILKGVLKGADSPEGVVNTLFTGPSSQIKGGSMDALRNLKKAYDTYLPPEAAKQAWDDVRLAYWLKLTTDRGAEVTTPGTLASAIKTVFGDHKSVANVLFQPSELASMRRLYRALDQVKRKNPNASWSSVGVGAIAKDAMNAVLAMLGGNSVLARTILGTVLKPIQNARGAAQAAQATGGLQGAQLRAIPGPSIGGLGGAAGSQSQQ
jgi:hypothetical protein